MSTEDLIWKGFPVVYSSPAVLLFILSVCCCFNSTDHNIKLSRGIQNHIQNLICKVKTCISDLHFNTSGSLYENFHLIFVIYSSTSRLKLSHTFLPSCKKKKKKVGEKIHVISRIGTPINDVTCSTETGSSVSKWHQICPVRCLAIQHRASYQQLNQVRCGIRGKITLRQTGGWSDIQIKLEAHICHAWAETLLNIHT